MIQKFDFLIIGSGIAGMSFALKVAHKGKVALICKTELEEANTYFAQGGVASLSKNNMYSPFVNSSLLMHFEALWLYLSIPMEAANLFVQSAHMMLLVYK